MGQREDRLIAAWLDEARDSNGKWTTGSATKHENKPTVDEHGNITVTIPTAIAKKYSRINPYVPEPGESAETQRSGLEYMGKLEHTLRSQGLDAFKNLPVIEVGESGKHAVLSDGNHRIWAADAIGAKNIRVNIITGEDDAWAKRYGFPVDSYLKGILGSAEAAKR